MIFPLFFPGRFEGLRKYIDCNYRAVKANSGLVSSACTAMAFHSDYKDNKAVSLMVSKFFARDQRKPIEEVTKWFFRNISANPLALTSSTSSRSQMEIICVKEIKWREARARVRISIYPCVYNINCVEWVCLSAHLSTHHSWARRKEKYGLASLRYFVTFLIISFLKKNLCLMHEHWAVHVWLLSTSRSDCPHFSSCTQGKLPSNFDWV